MARSDRWPSLDASGSKVRTGAIECACCNKAAAGWVSVRFGPMRGTDIDTFDVCQRHLTMANDWQQFKRFMAHLNTKERFLSKTRSES